MSLKDALLKSLVRNVQHRFSSGPPNGWSLGWDHGRYHGKLAEALKPFKVLNYTSFDYDFCNSYKINVPERNGQGRRWEISLSLSFIAPYYMMHWVYYRNPDRARFLYRVPDEQIDFDHRLRACVESLGFHELPSDWHDFPVDSVTLELSGSENVTLGKCLFSDSYR